MNPLNYFKRFVYVSTNISFKSCIDLEKITEGEINTQPFGQTFKLLTIQGKMLNRQYHTFE